MNTKPKIIITKKPNKYRAKRRMVELEIDTHTRLLELSVKTNRPLREIVDLLINDALERVKIQEEKNDRVEEPITLTDEQITEMWESGYISDKEEYKDGND